jgi:hypothetical protein
LVNILILRLCNYDKSPDHVESAGKFTLRKKKKLLDVGKTCMEQEEFSALTLVPRQPNNNAREKILSHSCHQGR